MMNTHVLTSKYHRRDLFGAQLLRLTAPIDDNLRLSMRRSLHNTKGKTLGLLGSYRIIERSSNNALHIIHSVEWVGRHLTLGRHAHQLALGREGHPRGHGPSGGGFDDLHLLGFGIVACHTGVGGTEVDSDDWLCHFKG